MPPSIGTLKLVTVWFTGLWQVYGLRWCKNGGLGLTILSSAETAVVVYMQHIVARHRVADTRQCDCASDPSFSAVKA